MAVTFNTQYRQNEKGAKESGELLAKPFKLEQALYTKVKEHEQAEAENLKPRSNREKKAVDFFLKRRIRCDKYVKESNGRQPQIELTEEELAKLEEERVRKAYLEKQKALNIETIAVEPIKGEVKMPPMAGINTQNNASLATPFTSSSSSHRASQCWASVKFGSVTDPLTSPGMVNSFMSINSIFDCAERTPLYNGQTKQYKPVNYMNFKSKQKSNQWKPGQKGDRSVDDILKTVRDKENAEKDKANEAARLGEKKTRYGPRPNGVDSIGLARVSLPDTTGKWRPSNDNWKPGVNTDGFFTALAALNEKKEENKNKKVVYGETSYKPAARSFADNSLASALNGI